MKKSIKIAILGMILALYLPIAATNAQVFDQGDVVVSFGLGLGTTYYVVSAYNKTTVPPLFISGDYCLREDLGPGNLGVGAYLGYSSYKSEWSTGTYTYGYKYNTLIIAARGTYHFTDLVEKLDLYGGVLLGAEITSHKEYGSYTGLYGSADSGGPAFSIFGGARYLFTDNFGVMGELGWGVAWLSLGVSLKF